MRLQRRIDLLGFIQVLILLHHLRTEQIHLGLELFALLLGVIVIHPENAGQDENHQSESNGQPLISASSSSGGGGRAPRHMSSFGRFVHKQAFTVVARCWFCKRSFLLVVYRQNRCLPVWLSALPRLLQRFFWARKARRA